MSQSTQAALLKQLKNPFDPKFVKWRVGATNDKKDSGIALAYIDSREVMKRLDDVCGIGNWQDRLVPVDGGFICEIDIKIDGEWVTRSNAASYTKVEPIKGGASDAFKRAASTWGIGRYLYYLPNVWVPIKSYGKSYTLVSTPELPSWAIPNSNVENWQDVAELELDATASADMQDIADIVIANIDKIRACTNTDELKVLVDSLDAEEQRMLSNEISNKTEELLNAELSKANSSRCAATK